MQLPVSFPIYTTDASGKPRLERIELPFNVTVVQFMEILSKRRGVGYMDYGLYEVEFIPGKLNIN